MSNTYYRSHRFSPLLRFFQVSRDCPQVPVELEPHLMFQILGVGFQAVQPKDRETLFRVLTGTALLDEVPSGTRLALTSPRGAQVSLEEFLDPSRVSALVCTGAVPPPIPRDLLASGRAGKGPLFASWSDYYRFVQSVVHSDRRPYALLDACNERARQHAKSPFDWGCGHGTDPLVMTRDRIHHVHKYFRTSVFRNAEGDTRSAAIRHLPDGLQNVVTELVDRGNNRPGRSEHLAGYPSTSGAFYWAPRVYDGQRARARVFLGLAEAIFRWETVIVDASDMPADLLPLYREAKNFFAAYLNARVPVQKRLIEFREAVTAAARIKLPAGERSPVDDVAMELSISLEPLAAIASYLVPRIASYNSRFWNTRSIEHLGCKHCESLTWRCLTPAKVRATRAPRPKVVKRFSQLTLAERSPLPVDHELSHLLSASSEPRTAHRWKFGPSAPGTKARRNAVQSIHPGSRVGFLVAYNMHFSRVLESRAGCPFEVEAICTQCGSTGVGVRARAWLRGDSRTCGRPECKAAWIGLMAKRAAEQGTNRHEYEVSPGEWAAGEFENTVKV